MIQFLTWHTPMLPTKKIFSSSLHVIITCDTVLSCPFRLLYRAVNFFLADPSKSQQRLFLNFEFPATTRFWKLKNDNLPAVVDFEIQVAVRQTSHLHALILWIKSIHVRGSFMVDFQYTPKIAVFCLQNFNVFVMNFLMWISHKWRQVWTSLIFG